MFHFNKFMAYISAIPLYIIVTVSWKTIRDVILFDINFYIYLSPSRLYYRLNM